MELMETAEQSALRAELRAYFASIVTPEVREELDRAGGEGGEGGAAFRRIVRRMGADGWLGIGWPEEFGGQGRPATDQFIFFTEVQRARAPFPFVTLNTVGPTLMRFGSDEQKAFFLPAILAGELNCAIGYTEPEAGHRPGVPADPGRPRRRRVGHRRQQDLHLRRRPGRLHLAGGPHRPGRPEAQGHLHLHGADGHARVLVHAHHDGRAGWPPRRPTTTACGCRPTHLVGERNEGWRMITNQLNHERVGLAAVSALAERMWDEVAAWAVDEGVADVGWVAGDLARARALLVAQHLLNWRMAAAVADETLGPADSSAVKVYGTESTVEVYRLLLGIVGAGGYLRDGSPGAVLHGELERRRAAAQINTFGGGVNEIQREILAMAGLGMKRAAR